MDPIVDAEVTDCLHSYLKRMKKHLEYQISGSKAIKVLDFLHSFKIAADIIRLSEGAAALVFPNFLSGRAKTGVVTHLKQISDSIPEYPAAVQWLLKSYATEAVITKACDRVNQAKKHQNEDEREFFERLGSYAADAGSVFPERQLIAANLSGLSDYVSATLRGRITPRIEFPKVQAFAEEIGIASKALTASRPPPRAPAPGLLPTLPRPVAAVAEDKSKIAFADAYYSALSGFDPAQSHPVAAQWSISNLKREYIVRTLLRTFRPHLHAQQEGGIVLVAIGSWKLTWWRGNRAVACAWFWDITSSFSYFWERTLEPGPCSTGRRCSSRSPFPLPFS
jgi:hypothetical protein